MSAITDWLKRLTLGKCPRCGNRALMMVSWVRATVSVDDKRAPASWSYYLCKHCGARLRRSPNQPWEDAHLDEWRRECAYLLDKENQ